MSKLFIEDTTLSAIGDAIRTKGGTADKIAPLDMPTAITNLPSGGEKNYTIQYVRINAPTSIHQININDYITNTPYEDIYCMAFRGSANSNYMDQVFYIPEYKDEFIFNKSNPAYDGRWEFKKLSNDWQLVYMNNNGVKKYLDLFYKVYNK